MCKVFNYLPYFADIAISDDHLFWILQNSINEKERGFSHVNKHPREKKII